MKYIYTLCLFIPFLVDSLSLYSQNDVSDKQKMVDSLLIVSYQQFTSIYILESIESANQALSLSEEINYSAGKATSSFYIARSLSYLGEYSKSFDYLLLCENEEYATNNIDINSEICRIRGQLYDYLGLSSKAVEEFHRGLSYIRQVKEPEKKKYLKSLAYENLAIVHKNLGAYDSLYVYLVKNERILSENNGKYPHQDRNWVNLYTLYGTYYGLTNQYDSAAIYFNKSLALAQTSESPYTSWTYSCWGDMELKKGEPDSALILYNYALQNLEETKIRNELPAIYEQISKIYSMKNMDDSTTVYHNKGIAIDNELLNSKSKTIDRALQIILENDRTATAQLFEQRLIYIFYFSFAILFFIWILWTRRERAFGRKLKIKETQMEDLGNRLSDDIQELIELAKRNDASFLPSFREVFPILTKNIYKKHPELINSELWLCAMIYLDFSSKETAQVSFVEHRSIQVRKSRLRKKLNIDSSVDLYNYIKSFDKYSV